METRTQSTSHTNKEVGEHDSSHFESSENGDKLRSASAEILKAAKNLKHVFETSATPLKQLIEQNTVLSKTWGDVNDVLLQATSSSQMQLLDTLIERLEKCSKQIDCGQPELDSIRKPINHKAIDLLMIGSAGNGKSATGNSILGKAVFNTASGMSATRSFPRKGTSTFEDLTISVVETPGVDTNGKSKLEVLEMSLDAIKESMEMCDYSFTALLVVIKFGARFTQHESDTIKTIRGVLGNDVIQKYGVCVVTHGDNFEFEMDEEKVTGNVMTFEHWCREQVGEIGELFKECSSRCVLFNNRTRDEDKRLRQTKNLVACIRCDQKYCKEDFINADEGLSKLTQELFLPQILEQTKTFGNGIRARWVNLKSGFNTEVARSKTQELLNEIHEYKDAIKSGIWQGSELAQLLGYLEPLEMEISSQLKLGDPEKGVNIENMDRDFTKKPPVIKPGHWNESGDKKTNKVSDFKNIEPVKEVTKNVNTVSTKKQFRNELKDLKKIWKTSDRSIDGIQRIRKKLETIKTKYAAFLNSKCGEKSLQKCLKFEQTLNSPRKNSDEDIISNRWKKIRSRLKNMAKLHKQQKAAVQNLILETPL